MAGINQQFLLQSRLFIIIALLKRVRERGGRKKHRFWVRKSLQRREELGAFHTLTKELRIQDREYFLR